MEKKKKKKSVEFVTCKYSPDSILVLSLSIFIQNIRNNTTIPQIYALNSHCIRISASCCRKDTQPAKPQVYMSENLASMTKTVRTIGSFAQGYSGLKGLFLPWKLWNGGVERICENVNCLAI